MDRNIVGWFEIPVVDMDRAIRFYESVLNLSLTRHPMGDFEMAWFPWREDKPGSSGSLVRQADSYKPSTDGVVIYLSSQTGDLNDELSRVEPAGGKVLLPKRQIAEEYGYMALITDTEGNRIALHSRN